MVRSLSAASSVPNLFSGKHDPLIQYASYISFAADAPGYGPLQSDSVIGAMSDAFSKEAGCRAQLEDCYAAGTKSASDNALCAAANDLCVRFPAVGYYFNSCSLPCLFEQNQDIFHPAIRGYDSSDLRQMSNSTSPFPPTYYMSFLNLDSVRAAIGATSEYDQCSNAVQAGFDFMGEVDIA